MRRTSVARRLDDFRDECHRRRIPHTIQRRAVLQNLLERHDHPTADQIFADVRSLLPGISRTTVYRVLETLVDLGVVLRIHHPGSSARFDGETRPHHHLVCAACGRVFDVVDARLDHLPRPGRLPSGFEVEGARVNFTGRCARCR